MTGNDIAAELKVTRYYIVTPLGDPDFWEGPFLTPEEAQNRRDSHWPGKLIVPRSAHPHAQTVDWLDGTG